MPLPSRRNGATAINVWPGWVDALSSLLMVVIFVLLVFTMAQFFLQSTLSGQDIQLERLNARINELTDQLALEASDKRELEATIARLTGRLSNLETERNAIRLALAEREEARAALEDQVISLEDRLQQLSAANSAAQTDLADQEQLTAEAQDQVAMLNLQLNALREELARLSSLLSEREATIEEQDAQIVNLGQIRHHRQAHIQYRQTIVVNIQTRLSHIRLSRQSGNGHHCRRLINQGEIIMFKRAITHRPGVFADGDRGKLRQPLFQQAITLIVIHHPLRLPAHRHRDRRVNLKIQHS